MGFNQLLLRWGTQDLLAANEVLTRNEYRLPYSFRDDDVIVDIGAQVGTFAYACKVERACGTVISYEPEASNYGLLRANMAAWGAGAKCYHNAVWSTETALSMFTAKPELTAMHQTLGFGDVVIKAVGINQVLEEAGKKIRLLKLDCEGAEVPILNAMKPNEGVQQIVGEIHYALNAPGLDKPTLPWLHTELKRLGFSFLILKDEWGKPGELNNMFWACRTKGDADAINRLANHQ